MTICGSNLDIVVEHNNEIIQKSEIIFGNKKNFALNFHAPGISIVLFPIILEFCIDNMYQFSFTW